MLATVAIHISADIISGDILIRYGYFIDNLALKTVPDPFEMFSVLGDKFRVIHLHSPRILKCPLVVRFILSLKFNTLLQSIPMIAHLYCHSHVKVHVQVCNPDLCSLRSLNGDVLRKINMYYFWRLCPRVGQKRVIREDYGKI